MNSEDEFDAWQFIDWDIDTDTLQFQLHAIEAWNQKNPDVKGHWDQWPDEMGELIVLPSGYIAPPWKTEPILSEEEETSLKQDWLKVAQLVSENENIEIEENTFTVKGKHGSTFRFDVSMEFSRWLPPNSLDSHIQSLRNIRNGARNRGYLDNHIANLEASFDSWKIETTVEEADLVFHDFPPHMVELKDCQYEGYYTFADPTEDCFPISLIAFIEMLIEDEEIWRMIHSQSLERRKALDEFDKKWPNGRPEDWMYL